MRRRNLIALAATVALLAGCNRVMSVDPWFTAVDANGAPRLRDGLWLNSSDPDCRVKTERPAERWPDCADAIYVRGDEWLSMRWDESGPRRAFVGWQSDPVHLIDGDPLIAQLGGEVSDEEADHDSSEPAWRYMYGAARPTQLDKEGRIVAYEAWGVQCGPLDRSGPEAGRDVTERPFAGLTVVGRNCTADSVAALRRAAVLSEPLEAQTTARWIRDGWR